LALKGDLKVPIRLLEKDFMASEIMEIEIAALVIQSRI
jgi:hypothetical protein